MTEGIPKLPRLSPEQRAELLWKWMLRLTGLAAFVYILVVKQGDVPAAVFVIVGGLIGLPNVVSFQQALNERKDATPKKKKEEE